jgi:hypothetical protein
VAISYNDNGDNKNRLSEYNSTPALGILANMAWLLAIDKTLN